MELTPEERQRIIERELARVTAQRQAKRKRRLKYTAWACLGCFGLILVVGVAAVFLTQVRPVAQTTARAIATATPTPTRHVPKVVPNPVRSPTPSSRAMPASGLIGKVDRANGYDWWAATETERIELCKWFEANARRAGNTWSPGWRFDFAGLNEFYRTDEPFILEQRIAEVAAVLSLIGY